MLKYANELKRGDVFIYDGREQVAIENYCGGDCIWVTTRRYYIYPEEDGIYGYTSACVMSINENDEVEVIENLEESNAI